MIKNEKKIIFDKLSPYLINNKIIDGLIDEILEVEKIKKEDFYSLFPYQTKSLCIYFFNRKNTHIKNINKKKVLKQKSISKKVTIYLDETFVFFEENKALSLFFFNYLVLHPFLLNKISLCFANFVWIEVKDKSVDFNYYSKRYILSKIYKNSLFYWRQTSDYNKTINFVEKQISSLAFIGKLKAKTRNLVNMIPMQNILSKLDFMH